ncbi:MAG: EscU/YscU/HrcU family type III secretion system export apparatus switch protein [Alcaligenaceae bacterium]|nr:EscU/YscU/HrcU family type III secretion system export apparatus switch protein [Alcaligenaceae bacterium SAGV5]MPS54997.1 EscU/YscU/HrcU family type III secretion system export apparatus switch protein [Alcaligenaceae bacterium SAGV3]MPT55591.1 EscU/YscU/HrcU family type III secretion system export apparatus switch protein [Alcaligenaceae bacterium]
MSEEKNEEPTDKKIEDAKKKGQIAVSRDLARLAMLLVVAEIAFATEGLWRGAIFGLMDAGVGAVGQDFSTAMQNQLMAALTLLAVVFFVVFIICPVVAVAAHWGQFGALVATEALEPKFDKLNPVNGFKQIISKKKLVELLITVGKATLIGLLSYSLIRGHLASIVSLAGGEPKDVYEAFVALLRAIFHVFVVVCLVLGIIDFAVQKYFHKKELMMDMEEIKREHKESEGDPLIKGQRKRLARQWANETPAARTEDANAVVVNPTHFAVAMFYDTDEAMVPVVLAKGKDEVAQAMIRRAHERGIPVIRHVWLARTLYATCREDTAIPRSSYQAVAQVYAVVHELVARGEVQREVELEAFGEQPKE